MDQEYIFLVIPAFVLSLFAQFYVKSTFKRFSKVMSGRGINGADAARMILANNGISNVAIEPIAGDLNDHYDPRSNTIRLSTPVYGNTSLAALGVAAHEAGHALQHAEGYAPIKLRNALVPVANIGSMLSIPLIFIGIFFEMLGLAYIGIWVFTGVLAFQLVTLPVEFNASSRAVAAMDRLGILTDDENRGAKKVLLAAGLTYVAAAAVTLAQILRFLSIINRRN